MEAIKRHLQFVVRIEVIMALGGFSALLLDPIRNEYLFRKVLGVNSTQNASSCKEMNNTDPGGTFNADVSRWTLLLDMALFLPASVAGLLLTSWSDRVGRKWVMVIPLIGMIISSVIFSLTLYFEWPLEALIFVTLSGGLGGYYMTLLMQGMAYLSDITTQENRGMRFVIMETCLGIAGGAAGIISGYWSDATGYFSPVASTILINLVALLMIAVIPDSSKLKVAKLKRKDDAIKGYARSRIPSSSSPFEETTRIKGGYTALDLLRSIWRVYTSEYSHCEKCFGQEDENQNYTQRTCIHGGGQTPGRRWRLWIYLISYDLYMFVNVGTMVFQIIYFLSPPICFTQILVGIQLGAKFIGVAFTPVVVLLYRRILNMSNNLIIIVGFVAMLTSCFVIGIATSELLVFIGTAIAWFSVAAKPFIQTQITSLVSEWEQGSVLALLSFSEILTFLAATSIFLLLYPITLPIYHGFCWMLAAGISFMAIILITFVYVKDRKRISDADDSTALLNDEID